MSMHSSMSYKAQCNRIDRDQTSGEPITPEAQKRTDEFVEMALERMKAEKLAASLPDLAGMFNAVADMTVEEEVALNAEIESDYNIFDELGDVPAYVYPPRLFLATREQFLRRARNLREAKQVRNSDPLTARRAEIEEALRDPFMDKQTAFTLLGELAEIQVKQDAE